MKRKILLTVAIAILFAFALITAIGATGVSSSEYGEITSVDGVADPTVIDKSAKVVLLANDGTYYTFPTYYILEDNASFTWKQNAEVSSILGYAQTGANSDFRPYVVRIEIPEGVTAINPDSKGGAYAFEDAKKLIEATIPSTMTVIGNYVFNRANSLATLNGFDSFMQRATKLGTLMLAETSWGTGIDLVIPPQITSIPENCFKGTKIRTVTFPSTLKTMGQRAFEGCTNLTSVELPASLESMKNHIFASCTSLESVDVSKCTNLKEIGNYCFEKSKITEFDFTPFAANMETIGVGLFNDCVRLETVTGYELVDCATTVGSRMFYQCPLKEIKLPKNITAIEEWAFYKHASTQTELRIPNTVESIGNHAFARAGKGGGAGLKIYLSASLITVTNNYTFENWCYSEMYIPSSLMSIAQGFCNNTLQSGVVYYYTGELNGLPIDATNNSAMLNAEWISVDAFAGASGECNYIVYGYNACDAFYDGKHAEKTDDNNPCILADCENCNVKNLYVGNESTHSETTTIVYESFDKEGSKIVYCTNKGCTHNVITETPALFTCFAYSLPEDGRGGIAIGYTVNNVAIREYEEITGKTLKYGVFAVSKDRLGDNDIFGEDGTVAEGVINAEITNHQFVAFELKIVGFTDKQKDTKLALGAYVAVTDGETTEYSYMQDDTNGELVGKYYFVSYNDIVE